MASSSDERKERGLLVDRHVLSWLKMFKVEYATKCACQAS